MYQVMYESVLRNSTNYTEKFVNFLIVCVKTGNVSIKKDTCHKQWQV